MSKYHRPQVVIHLVGDGFIYISQRQNCPIFNGLWQSPGGSAEEGETIFEAAARELREETGLDLPDYRFEYWGNDSKAEVPQDQYKCTVHHFGVYLRDGEVPQNTEPDRHSDWEKISKADLLVKEDVLPGLKLNLVRERL